MSSLAYRRILELIHQGTISSALGYMLLRESGASADGAANRPEPPPEVAVIGLSCRFADAANAEQFWTNLASGRDSVREVPESRWSVAEHFSPDPLSPNKTYSKWGGWLADIDLFDPEFFSMSPREARLMDPQQRLFLMEAWNAFENAGYGGGSLDGVRCGVFVGCGAGDYRSLLQQAGVPLEGYTFTGTHASILAARIAYSLNLRGPALAIDTACSSSLVALHLACESIRSGATELALAGGVTVLTTPELHILASKSGMLSPRGRCSTFDDSADGFVPGEGVAAVILKSLPQAIRDGDHIYGVIAGSGTNQDGKTSGITAPSGPSQTALELEVYRRFGIDPAQISYVECHGTGTKLGDPIEVDALTAAFRAFAAKDRFCVLGSVKTNIGHTIAAAGMAGLIKILMCMRHQKLVPSLHYQVANRHWSEESTPFTISVKTGPWQGPRVAALSSFGFSGTNAHVVVREAPARPPRSEARARLRTFLVSARTEQTLRARLGELGNWLEGEGSSSDVRDVAFTLNEGRTRFAKQVSFAAGSLPDLALQLRSYRVQLQTDAPSTTGEAEPREEARRIPLPGYPFARERYWVPEPASIARRRPEQAAATAALPQIAAPPMLPQPGETVICRRLLTPQDAVVRDHLVTGIPLLPAAGHLALLFDLAAPVINATQLTARKGVWLRPLFVAEPTEVQVHLKGLKDGNLAWEIRTDRSDQVFSRGELARLEQPGAQALDLVDIASRCTTLLHEQAVYESFSVGGIDYGPYFRSVIEVLNGEHEALALLRRTSRDLPVAAALDAAVQSMAALDPPRADKGPEVPFAMQRVHLLQAIPEQNFYAYARMHKNGNCDLTITDARGTPCLLVEGLATRELKEPVATRALASRWYPHERAAVGASGSGAVAIVSAGDALGLDDALVTHHAPRAVALVSANAMSHQREALVQAERIYFLGGLESRELDLFSIADAHRAQARGVESLLALVTLLNDAPARLRELVVVTNDVCALEDSATLRPHAASLHGFCKSLAKEQETWRVGIVDVCTRELRNGSLTQSVRAIAQEPSAGSGQLVRMRGGQAWVHGLAPLELPRKSAPPYRNGGCYLIVGGAGGIGGELAVRLASRHAARIVLLGRRDENASIKALLTRVREAGGEAIYLAADVANEAAMRAALGEVRSRFGRIDGAFHSALVLRDGLLERMRSEDLSRALAPKVDGSIALASALREDRPDFLVFFSSAVALSGNAGQANYAAACAFEDAYAQALARSGMSTYVVNWGFWGEIGVAAKASYRQRMAAHGVHSIGVADGFEQLDTLLAQNVAQAVVIKAERRVLESFGLREADRIDARKTATREEAAPVRPSNGQRSSLAAAAPEARRAAPALPASQAVVGGEDSLLARTLSECVARNLDRAGAELDWERPFTDYGVDSIVLMDIVRSINEALGIELSGTALFDYPTLRELTQYVAEFAPHLEQSQQLEPANGTAHVEAASTRRSSHAVEEALAECIANSLGRDGADLDWDTPFTDYGVDSIILVEMVNTINERLGTSLTGTALFDYPNINELAAFVRASGHGERPTEAEPEVSGRDVAAKQRSSDPDLAVLEKLADGSLNLELALAELGYSHE